MKASTLLLTLALAAGTTAALAAPGDPAGAADSTRLSLGSDALRNGIDFTVQNEAEKHRLEAQGFPQYTD